MKDFLGIFIRENFLGKLFSITQDPHFQQITATYVPVSYDWLLFILGEILILSAIFINYAKIKQL